MSNVAVPTTHSQAPAPARYIKVLDVARLMGVPRSTVYDLARQDRIPGVVRFGRRIRFDRQRLQEWLDGGGEREAA